MALYATRGQRDNVLYASATLPNAANTVNGGAIDLGAAAPFPFTENVQVRIANTVALSANTLNINLRLQDSADNSSWTNVAQTANPILKTLGVGVAYPAANVIIALPPNIRRYIRAVCTGEANGGDASNGTFTCEVLL